MKQTGYIIGVLLAISLTGCASLPSTEKSPTGTDQSTEGISTTDYLSKIDANGLIDGKSYSRVVGEATVMCLAEKGWDDVELSDTGAITFHDASKSTQFDTDMQQCSEDVAVQYPVPPVTDRALGERFELELSTRDCLIGLGYSITDAPSKKTWIEQMRSASPEIWLPYAELFSDNKISPTDEKQIKQTCPDPAERIYIG